MGSTKKLILGIAAAIALVIAAAPAEAEPRPTPAGATSAQYQVVGPNTWTDVNNVAATGSAIDSVEHGKVYVTATPAEVIAIRKLGFTLVEEPKAADGPQTFDFPSADSAYHNYAEMTAELNQIVADHPAIARLQSIGTSYEGRTLYAL